MSQLQRESPRYRTLEEIEEIAAATRRLLGLDSVLSFLRYAVVLEKLPQLAPGYSLRVVPDDAMDAAARVVSELNQVQVRKSLDFHGRRGDPHSLMCMVHELSHLLLGHNGVRCKIPGLNIRQLTDPDERRDEWEANRLAGAILMPAEQGMDCRTDSELSRRFDVTDDAARHRRPQIEELGRRREELERRKTGALRALPTSVIRFLWESKSKTGLPLESLQNEDRRRRAEAQTNALSGQACTRCGYFNIICSESTAVCSMCGQEMV